MVIQFVRGGLKNVNQHEIASSMPIGLRNCINCTDLKFADKKMGGANPKIPNRLDKNEVLWLLESLLTRPHLMMMIEVKDVLKCIRISFYYLFSFDFFFTVNRSNQFSQFGI